MENVQHEKSATWKMSNMKKVQQGKVQQRKSAIWKECNMEIVEA